ncbi:tripartite-type tricarboxylate transporter receptor subunit TctC [Anaerobacterium chartisolvens]|uniref:Tripartite-type tricarboxylate transporter receptor subunit TctC n=1 Tax=Anaerobacterium chartisolvens TaxID=1297424 RepID=A0A369BFL8_9FIRM|nr:tripartite tricarboxylate transporter substrate binding protein [Anaerobacterium chartisolvens]RCX19356.1 tripartite-type tricarboxylate transporter receptor subunit TctC [Anaerobacterium chartisolvens]
MYRKLMLIVLCIAMVATMVTGCAAGKGGKYPANNIEVIVPKGAGGGTDTSTRGLLTYMEKNLEGAKFNVTNNSDGGGITGMIATAGAKPDGYTLGAVTVELDMFCFQGKTDLTFEKYDAIAMPIAAPAALIVQANAPYNSIDEFVAYCKKSPGTVQVGNSGSGAIWDIATYLAEKEYGISVTHVPYPNGTADIAAALTGGHIDATFADPSSFMTQIEAGSIKCLGVMAAERTSLLPNVPTFKEQGHDLVVRAWAALVAPKGVEAEKLKMLRDAAKAALESDECKQYFKSQGIDPVAYIGDDAYKIMKDDYDMYKEVFETYDFGQ